MTTRLRSAVAVCALVGLLAACRPLGTATGGGAASSAAPGLSVESAPGPVESTSPSTTDPNFGTTAYATYQADDTSATFGFAVGSPRAARSSPEAQACIAGSTTSTGHEVTVPIRITETLHGSSPERVGVNYSTVDEVGTDGSVSPTFGGVRWSVKYSQTPQECKGGGLSDAAVDWASANPGATNTFVAWMVLSDGVSDSDPDGRQAAGQLLLQPIVTLGDSVGVPELNVRAAQVVQCSSADDFAAGRASYLAIVPGIAVHYGCTSTSASDEIEAARDRICQATFPDTSSRTVNGTTIYDKSASLFQICEGFGSDDVHFTTDMTCAVLGLLSNEVGRYGNRIKLNDISRLCDTNSVVESLRDGTWASEAGQVGCEVIGGIFAEGLGIAAAGATAETGAGEVIGVATYHALQVGVSLACDGSFRDALSAFGAFLEAHHETHVARDVVSEQDQCLKYDPGAILKHWSTTTCPS